MNEAHVHLALNHGPVVGSLLVLILLLYAWLMKQESLFKVALLGTVLVGGMALIAYITGEPAEEYIEHIKGISESAIEAHEDAAFIGLLVLGIISIIALVGVIWGIVRTSTPVFFVIISAIGMAVGIVLMGWVANLGGKIRHSEINDQPPVLNSKDRDD